MIRDRKDVAIQIRLEHRIEIGDRIRRFGYPVAPEENWRHIETSMFCHESDLQQKLPPIEGIPGALIRGGVGKPGVDGSGGPWLRWSIAVGAMAWQMQEE